MRDRGLRSAWGDTRPAILLLSGGMDSAVAGFVVQRRHPLHAITFSYGQRHEAQEVAAAKKIAGELGAPHEVLPISGLPRTPLTGDGAVTDAISAVVPGRNTIFLTLAAARAQQLGMHRVVIGCCRDDADTFPDCRPGYLLAAETMLRLGIGDPEFTIMAPLVGRTKAAIVRLARELDTGALWEALTDSWTCYAPCVSDTGSRRCNTCSACRLRARGFAEAGVQDPGDAC